MEWRGRGAKLKNHLQLVVTLKFMAQYHDCPMCLNSMLLDWAEEQIYTDSFITNLSKSAVRNSE